jgi:hypothetical protein
MQLHATGCQQSGLVFSAKPGARQPVQLWLHPNLAKDWTGPDFKSLCIPCTVCVAQYMAVVRSRGKQQGGNREEV